ncbi:MAG: hypothetical protein K0S32_2689 [Bacteroidetes bacterium]|jgi:hypothetical protein|nr:hypothetical protein [Bacteroidota bacterium]
MAVPRKGFRRITVDNVKYWWKTTGQDYGISLTIAGESRGGQLLVTGFDYHHKLIKVYDNGGQGYAQQITITPFMVRQVIELGLKSGWKPDEKGEIFYPAIDGKIEIRLREIKGQND